MNPYILFAGAITLILLGFMYRHESYLACGITLIWIGFSILIN